MKKVLWTLAVVVTILCGAYAIISHDNGKKIPLGKDADDVKIAIAWRSDTDNEFCTNMVEAFKAAGVDVVVLPQVKAPYISYDGTTVSASCLDSAGIGYLNGKYGAMVRTKGHEGSNVSSVLTGVKGVVFTGGEDIAPTLYAVQEDWHHVEADIDYNAARDVSDYLTMLYCLDHDIPVIGFCRGAQMLGVVSGATMIQDIPTWLAAQGLPYNYEHRRERAGGENYRDYTPHTVTIADSSLLSKFCTTDTLQGCPSWHQQALLSTKKTPLRCVGITTTSGVEMVEAVERTDKHCAIGLQFHPEAAIAKHLDKGVYNGNANVFMPYDDAVGIFKTFIDYCK